MDDNEPFIRAATLIRHRRYLLGVHPHELATRMQITPALLGALESGRYDPRGLHLIAQRELLRALDLTWEHLIAR